MFSTAIIIIFGIALTMIAQIPLKGSEIKWTWLGFFAHIIGTFTLVWITQEIYGYGDMLTYHRLGNELAVYIQHDYQNFPKLFNVIFNLGSDLPFAMVHRGGSTASMIGLTTFSILIIGNSLYANSLVFSLASFSGSYAIYLVFRRVFPDIYRTRLAIVSMLFPSSVFWTSGILKEAVAICGFGWLFFGAYRWVSKRYTIGFFFILFGGTIVGISKAYILFPFTISFGAWIFWRKSIANKSLLISKPFYIILGILIAIGGVIALGTLFPRYAPTQVIESTTTLQGYGTRIRGESSYQLIDPNDNSLSAQIIAAPLALISTLFRPFFFEAHNILSAINAVETTLLLILILLIFYYRRPKEILSLIGSSPTLIFCVVFVITFGLGVGLASTNLGTLSRYRIPLLPFYGAIIVTLLPFWNSKTQR